MTTDSERSERALLFRQRLQATGLGITEFQRRSGLTRNVVYNLSKGQKPSSAEQSSMLDEAFKALSSTNAKP